MAIYFSSVAVIQQLDKSLCYFLPISFIYVRSEAKTLGTVLEVSNTTAHEE